MLNKIYLLLFLVLTTACSGGGGGSSSGGLNTPAIPTNPSYSELTKDYSLPASQSLNLNLENDSAISIVTEISPTKGTLSGTYPNLTYTANSAVTGQDQAVLFITKTGSTKRLRLNFFINNIPVAQNFSISVVKSNGISFNLLGSDLDGDPLTYIIIQAPNTGTFYHTTTGKEAAYDAPNTAGSTTLFYQVSDGKALSNIGRVDIIIAASLPVFTSPASYTVTEDIASTIAVSASDSSGGGLAYSLTQNPINGVISGSNGNYTYTPNLNYSGTDSFKVRATNASAGFTEKIISLTISPVNDAPVFPNLSSTILENTDTFFIAGATDVENNNLTFTVETPATLGLAYINADRIFYSPNSNTTGVDTFLIKVCDNGQPILCASSSVEITITRQAKAPVAQDSTIAAQAGVPVQITLSGVYYNASNVSVQILNQPTKGTLVSNGGLSYTYTPNLNSTLPGAASETDSFNFTLSEDGFTSEQAIVTINTAYTYNYIGLEFDGILRELSDFSSLLHKDSVTAYSLGTISYQETTPDGPLEIEEFYLALDKNSLVCSNQSASFKLINLSNSALNPGEVFQVNSTDYACQGNLLKNQDQTESIYMNDHILIRSISDEGNDRFETQFGVKSSSEFNSTSLSGLLALNLTNISKLSITAISKEVTRESNVNLNDLIVQDNIAGEVTLKYFFKSSETLPNYQNDQEVFSIFHEIIEENGELKLVNKYYLTTSGMRPVQMLLDEWFAVRPNSDPADEPFTVSVDAGRILVIDDVVILRRQESVRSFIEIEEDTSAESFYYFVSDEAVLEVYNQKL